MPKAKESTSQKNFPRKQRFRDVKQRNIKSADRPKKEEQKKKIKSYEQYATARQKIKAFLTDAFMLLMPIMYVVFYLIMGGREAFADNRLIGWIYILVPLIVVQSIFFYRTGQTPGYRAYDIILIDEHSKKRPSLFSILFRNIAAVLSFFTFFGWILMFFRKDSKTLHDLLSATAVVQKYE